MGDFRFQRIIDLPFSDAFIVLDGFENSFGRVRRAGLTLMLVDRGKNRVLSVYLDPPEIEELLKCLVEFAGKVKLGELTVKEAHE